MNEKTLVIVEEVIKKDVSNRMDDLQDMQPLFNYELKAPSASYLGKLTKPLSGDIFTFYLILKGCLHRADHSGSAHLDVEEKPYGYYYPGSNRLSGNRSRKGIDQRRIWQDQLANSVSNQNIVLYKQVSGSGSENKTV